MYNADQAFCSTSGYYSVQQSSSFLTDQNPNPALYPQSSDSFYCHPPGVDPYGYPTAYAPEPGYPTAYAHVPGGVEWPTLNYSDPNATSQNWVVEQDVQVSYPTPMLSTSETGVATSANSNLQLGCDQTNVPPANMIRPSVDPSAVHSSPSLVNNVQKSASILTQTSKTVKCELCNIICNTIDLYQKHLSGKKHKNKLQTKYGPSTINVNPAQEGVTSGAELRGVSYTPTDKQLDEKKQKLLKVGVALDSLRVCNVCNIACNSEVVFADHISGKKHIAQLGMLAAITGQPLATLHLKPKSTSAVKPTPKKGPKEIKPAQSAWCEVCKVSCNDTEALKNHQKGKKHLKNVEKQPCPNSGPNLQKKSLTTIASTNPLGTTVAMEKAGASTRVHSTASNSAKRKVAARGNLEVKKQKVIQGGAAADAVRTCTVCNVVCNSEKVYTSHIYSQKHAAMELEHAKAKKVGLQT